MASASKPILETILLFDFLAIAAGINNIVFAINKTDGKLYFKPVSIKVPFRLYSNNLEGNLIDICIYKSMIYVVTSTNKVLRCPIIVD